MYRPPIFPLLLFATTLAGISLTPHGVRAEGNEEQNPREQKLSSDFGIQLSDVETVELGEGVKMEFVLIRPGSFMMGSPSGQSDEISVHQVTLTQPFYLGRYEVTQEQWQQVTGANPSKFKGTNLPVESVSWEDCQFFLTELQNRTGRKFALPTEAEWEYACRAGTTNQYSFGDDQSLLSDYAWYAFNSELRTHPVGGKKPNSWGLYDMHGNVFEWCADWYSASYSKGDAMDPRGPSSGDSRQIRGGAWLYVPDNLRSSERAFSPPDYRSDEYGLRCVLRIGDEIHRHAEPKAGANLEQAKLAVINAAIAVGDRVRAESLFAESKKLLTGDSRLAGMRSKLSQLPWPKENLVIGLGNAVTMELMLVRPGSFVMGSDEAALLDQKPARRVTIAQPFYLGKFEVTQEQWSAVMSNAPSIHKSLGSEKHPVENISWNYCQLFLAQLNEKISSYKFRLPTEAEWEYACRAGSTNTFSFGNDASACGEYAWFGPNAGGQTKPVGQMKPNAWGLHDMHGNVWEWCEDVYAAYPGGKLPTGGINSKSSRVLRGGAFNSLAGRLASRYRHDLESDQGGRESGFRCVAIIKGSSDQ